MVSDKPASIHFNQPSSFAAWGCPVALTEVECDAALICPEVHVAGDELAALIDPDRLGIARSSAYPWFDPALIAAGASYEDPKRPAIGLQQTWVNGRCVWRDTASTGARPGKMLDRNEGTVISV